MGAAMTADLFFLVRIICRSRRLQIGIEIFACVGIHAKPPATAAALTSLLT